MVGIHSLSVDMALHIKALILKEVSLAHHGDLKNNLHLYRRDTQPPYHIGAHRRWNAIAT
jgi:hypothetical protein